MTATAEDTTRLRLLGVVLLGLAAFWLAAISYVLHAAFPFNVLSLPIEEDIDARLWSPQGWKFFTRSPREDWLLPYRKTTKGWQSALLGPNGRLDAYAGISRAPRAQGIEMGLLLYKLPRGMWDKCTRDPVICLRNSPIKATLKNKTPNPTLCGMVGFVYQEQTPWAWAYSGVSPAHMPSRVAKFEVKC
jgi:antimicrobial peptide system SdpA family protein